MCQALLVQQGVTDKKLMGFAFFEEGVKISGLMTNQIQILD